MVNIVKLGMNVILPLLLLVQKSKYKKKKQKKEKEKDEKEKKKKKRHHHHHHHSEGDGRDSVQNGTVEEEEEPLPVSHFPTPLYTTVCEQSRVVRFCGEQSELSVALIPLQCKTH